VDNAAPFLFIFAIVGLAALFGYLAYLDKKRRREMFLWIAAKLGLRYDEEDPFDTVDLPFDLFQQGDRRGAENVLSGKDAGVPVRLFDYYYVVTSTNAQGHSTSTTHKFSCVIGEIDADCPHLTVEREGAFAFIARHLGFHDIEFESDEFNRAFKVNCEDKKFAYAMVDPRMMQWLMEEGAVAQYETMGPLVLCYTDRCKPEEYENLLEVFRRYRAHVPAVVASLYPRSKEARA
jgi:hypothetical protein